MAVFSIADMSAAMSTVYRRKVSQTQRKTPTLRLLAAIAQLNRGNTGIAMNWTPKFNGQAAGNSNLDGGPFQVATSDVPVAASLDYGTYEAPARITDDMLWRGGPSAGISAEYNTFDDVYAEQMVDAIEAALKLMEQQVYSGTGSSQQMTGLSTAVANSGIYAGINSSTYTQWKSYYSGNSGSLRSLTLAMIKLACRTTAVNSKAGRPDIALCPPAIMDAVEALFDAYLKIETTPSGGMAMPGPTRERLTMNPSVINTVGGRIGVDGFRVMKWENQNLYFVEAPDCLASGETNTTNVMYFLNSGEIGMDYLTPPGPRRAAQDAQAVAAVEQDMGPLANLQFEVISRGRVDHAMQWDVTSKAGIKLISRSAHGLLADIQ